MIRCESFPLGDIPDFVFPLWREAFGDSENTIRHILSAASAVYAGFLLDDCEACAGIACSFDVHVGDQRGKYYYAVCTAKQYRGQGVMRAVLDQALSEAKREGCSFAFLIPAKEEYFPMYEKLGFNLSYPGLISMSGRKSSLTAEEFNNLPIVQFDGDTNRLYNMYIQSPQTVVRKSEKLFSLSLEDREISYLSRNGVKNTEGYVVFERNGKKSINILEIRGCSDEISGIIKRDVLPKLFVCGDDGAISPGYAAQRKALFRFFSDIYIPADTPIDLFLEL